MLDFSRFWDNWGNLKLKISLREFPFFECQATTVNSTTWEPKRSSEQKCKPEKRLPWWSTSSPRWLKSTIGEILLWPGAELDPLPTLNKSQGTKIFMSKFLSYHKNQMVFYEDFGFMWLKWKFYAKNRSISAFSYLVAKTVKIRWFLG